MKLGIAVLLDHVTIIVRGDERLAPLLDRITSQTFRASEIVNSLLNFSRTGNTEFSEIGDPSQGVITVTITW